MEAGISTGGYHHILTMRREKAVTEAGISEGDYHHILTMRREKAATEAGISAGGYHHILTPDFITFLRHQIAQNENQ